MWELCNCGIASYVAKAPLLATWFKFGSSLESMFWYIPMNFSLLEIWAEILPNIDKLFLLASYASWKIPGDR